MANDNQIAVKKRLIYAEDLFAPVDRKVHIIGGRNTGKTMAMYEQLFRERVAMAPTIDAVEVVHGRFEAIRYGYGCLQIATCSVCGEKQGLYINGRLPSWNYCPNCGAKMDGDMDD
jgi:hypothetical protein